MKIYTSDPARDSRGKDSHDTKDMQKIVDENRLERDPRPAQEPPRYRAADRAVDCVPKQPLGVARSKLDYASPGQGMEITNSKLLCGRKT